MNKRSLIVFALLLTGGGLAWLVVRWYGERDPSLRPFSEKELAKAAARLHPNAPTQPAVIPLAPLDPSQRIRLAVGWLGLPDETRNGQVADLLTAELTGTKGLELVDRQSLGKVLRELELNLSGLVRAKDAVRVGKLLKADWFLLGSAYTVGGSNAVVVRIVDARTGILREVGVFQGNQDPPRLAAELAGFARQCRQAAATTKSHMFLAVGGFADVGVNARQSAFPTQLRAYLTSAYQHSNLTLLERDAVDALLQEVRLDLAGLTEESNIREAPPLQSAFWVVDGFFQSYETSGFEVELILNIKRAFGGSASLTLRGQPGEALFHRIKDSIDETLAKTSPYAMVPTRRREIGEQLDMGQNLIKASWGQDPMIALSHGQNQGNEQDHPRRRRNLEEATRALETVLLLDHTNRQAKLLLGACLLDWTIDRPEEARNYFREVANSTPPDKWSQKARSELGLLNFGRFGSDSPEDDAGDWIKLGPADPKALEQAEKRLLETVRRRGLLAFDHFVLGFGTNEPEAADHLVGLWPRLKQQCPDLAPQLLADLVSYLASTNSPVIAEFRDTLATCVDHPEKLPGWRAFLGTAALVDYQWVMNKGLYPLALEIMQAKRQVTLKQPEITFGEEDKVRLAFAFAKLERWREALTLFEELGENPIDMDRVGPWGDPFKPFLPAVAAAACRAKLNLPPVELAGTFDFGPPCLCLHTPSVFAATEDALWVAIGGRLLQLDLNLATNLQIALPVDGYVPLTALCVGPEQVWIGTEGAGLIEYDKVTRKCRLMTEADGLLLNDIACLCQQGKVLWIGCGHDAGGGLGQPGGLARLDLSSGRISAFTPSLAMDPLTRTSTNPFETTDPSDGPPAHAITELGGGLASEVLILVGQHGLRRYLPAAGSWSPLQGEAKVPIVGFTTDRERLVAGLSLEQIIVTVETKPKEGAGTNLPVRTNLIMTPPEFALFQVSARQKKSFYGTTRGTLRDKGGLRIYDLREARWNDSLDTVRLPAPPTRVLVEGADIWVAGWGYVAVVDTSLKSVRRTCYISSRTVDRIQIAGGYLWAQFDKHLHKAPLSATR
jgi:tetratricopeptide (TPR) repeat protein